MKQEIETYNFEAKEIESFQVTEDNIFITFSGFDDQLEQCYLDITMSLNDGLSLLDSFESFKKLIKKQILKKLEP